MCEAAGEKEEKKENYLEIIFFFLHVHRSEPVGEIMKRKIPKKMPRHGVESYSDVSPDAALSESQLREVTVKESLC